MGFPAAYSEYAPDVPQQTTKRLREVKMRHYKAKIFVPSYVKSRVTIPSLEIVFQVDASNQHSAYQQAYQIVNRLCRKGVPRYIDVEECWCYDDSQI